MNTANNSSSVPRNADAPRGAARCGLPRAYRHVAETRFQAFTLRRLNRRDRRRQGAFPFEGPSHRLRLPLRFALLPGVFAPRDEAALPLRQDFDVVQYAAQIEKPRAPRLPRSRCLRVSINPSAASW